MNIKNKERQELVVPEKQEISPVQLEGDPNKVLAFATRASKALVQVVALKPKPVIINQEQYLEFEDWQTVARFYGATVGIDWTRPIMRDGQTWGYEAKAIVLRGGETISSAEAMCTRDEDKWNKRAKYEWQGQYPYGKRVKAGEEPVPEFQLRSMAQTRACAKALRNVFAWVVVLAGYKPTPAEEITDIIPQQEEPSQTNNQKAKIVTLLKKLKVGATDKEGYRLAVKEMIQLELIPENYAEIISRLEVLIRETEAKNDSTGKN